MEKLSSYLTNYIFPSGGFSEGQFKDDPGDGTGSGAVVKTINDLWYGLAAIAKKYIGGISDTAESETASDMMDAIERAIGIKNENVIEYNNTTTYSQDAHVIRLGIQFVSMVNSNTGNDPFSNLDKWLPCFNRDDAVVKWRNGENVSGGFETLHDFRDAGYRQLFGFGQYNLGGDGGSNYQATGVHLDGTVVTGNTTLENLFDVGGGAEYHLLDIVAPDVLGTRTLLDVKGCVAASVDAGGGNREIVGGAQEDKSQGHRHEPISGSSFIASIVTGGTIDRAPGTIATISSTTGDPITDGTNGTPRTGLETQMKNYSVGISYILVFQLIP